MDVEFTVNLIQGTSTAVRAWKPTSTLWQWDCELAAEALKQATTQLARWLERDYHLTPNETAIVLALRFVTT